MNWNKPKPAEGIPKKYKEPHLTDQIQNTSPHQVNQTNYITTFQNSGSDKKMSFVEKFY